MDIKKKRPKKFREAYHICPNCGELNTETSILEEVSEGSCGMCYCEFSNGRILNKYKKINKKLWGELKGLKNNKLRLKRYMMYMVEKKQLNTQKSKH